jgi:type I restriction enzyme S subunit
MPLIRIRDIKPAKASTYYSGACIDEYRIKKGDILVGMDGEFNLGRWNDRDGLLNQRVLKLTGKKSCCIAGYLYHYMGPVFKKIEKSTAGGSVKHLSAKVINNILIPIPSLEEQERIVGILDTFTASIDNIKAQIEQRRKQYEGYLDKFYYSKKEMIDLANKGEIQTKALDEIGTFTRGRRFVRTDIVSEGVPCIHYGDMYTHYGVKADTTPTYLTEETAKKLRFAQNGDVVIVGAGENDIDIGVGVAWLGEEDVVIHDACYIFKHGINPIYLSYFMRSNNYHQQIKMGVVDGKICSISAKELGRTLIPLPTLARQQEIVSILDTFEASIDNLEAQLEQRQKQYEYYREKLLTFE